MKNERAELLLVLDVPVPIIHQKGIAELGVRSFEWARRRKIDLAELIDEPWILTGPTAWNRKATVLVRAWQPRFGINRRDIARRQPEPQLQDLLSRHAFHVS